MGWYINQSIDWSTNTTIQKNETKNITFLMLLTNWVMNRSIDRPTNSNFYLNGAYSRMHVQKAGLTTRLKLQSANNSCLSSDGSLFHSWYTWMITAQTQMWLACTWHNRMHMIQEWMGTRLSSKLLWFLTIYMAKGHQCKTLNVCDQASAADVIYHIRYCHRDALISIHGATEQCHSTDRWQVCSMNTI